MSKNLGAKLGASIGGLLGFAVSAIKVLKQQPEKPGVSPTVTTIDNGVSAGVMTAASMICGGIIGGLAEDAITSMKKQPAEAPKP